MVHDTKSNSRVLYVKTVVRARATTATRDLDLGGHRIQVVVIVVPAAVNSALLLTQPHRATVRAGARKLLNSSVCVHVPKFRTAPRTKYNKMRVNWECVKIQQFYLWALVSITIDKLNKFIIDSNKKKIDVHFPQFIIFSGFFRLLAVSSITLISRHFAYTRSNYML